MATANGSAAGATPAQRDLQSIPFQGHTIYVWRQPEPTKHAFAWRVVRDVDRQEIATGEADATPRAWEQAIAVVSHGSTPADAPKTKTSGYVYAGDLFRDLGDRALKGMTRAELLQVVHAGMTVEESANNLARLTEGLGCLMAADADPDAATSAGNFQGTDVLGALAPIAESIRTLEAVAYVSNFAALKLLQPEIYGAAVDSEARHG